MQDFFLTLVVVFVIFRILSSFRSSTVYNNTYNQTNYNPNTKSSKEGEVKVTYIKEKEEKKKKGNTGDYVDYEEIK